MKLSLLAPPLLALPCVLAKESRWNHYYPEAGPNGPPLSPRGHIQPRTTPKTANYSYEQLFQLQTNFLDAFIYPNNEKEAKAINSTLFSEDVQGRVDITRTFDGRELNTEYIFGLFANLAAEANAFTLLGYATSYEVVHFAASGNIASASTRFNFTFPVLGKTPVPIVIDTWNVFNDRGEISMYDATFKWWQWTVDFLLESAGKLLQQTDQEKVVAYAVTNLADSICDTAMTYCNGTNEQYESKEACQKFLTRDVRFGKTYELGRNTLLCRMVHQNMVALRPEVHCSHIGPSGGGYCGDDKSYRQTVTEEYFSNYPFVVDGTENGTKVTTQTVETA